MWSRYFFFELFTFVISLHFTREETEARRDKVMCPRPYGYTVAELGLTQLLRS